MSWKNKIGELMTYKRLVNTYCKKRDLTPYQFLLVRLIDGNTTNADVTYRLLNSGFTSQGRVSWYSSTGDSKSYNLDSTWYTIKSILKRKGYINYESSRGRNAIVNLSLTKKGKQLIANWIAELNKYQEDNQKELKDNKELAEDIISLIDPKASKFLFNLQELPKKLQDKFQGDAEEAYLQLTESLLQNLPEDFDSNKIKSLPIFLNIPKDMNSTNYSKDYYKGGLTLISGWITGISQTLNLNMGELYRCNNNKNHVNIYHDKVEICEYCGAGVERQFGIDMPVYQVIIETEGSEKIKAYVHADFWKPIQSVNTRQRLLLLRIKEKSRLKIAQRIKYMVIGLEIDDTETAPELERAEELAQLPTADILSTIDNSLFSDIAGLKVMKDAAIITLASINSQRLNIEIKGEMRATRGILNTLMWGEGGTGKTEVAKRLIDLVAQQLARGQAGHTSERGWTASYDAENKHIKAGIIPMNNTRAVLIDELDKFDNFTFLLQPLEEKRIDYAKAGLSVTYDAHTVTLMTANNKKTPIDSEPIQQLKKEIEQRGRARTPIIERCDIVCVLKNSATSGDILLEWMKAGNNSIHTIDFLKNYFEALRLIEDVYIKKDTLRMLSEFLTKENINLTARRLQSFMRICGAIAKLHLRDEVTETDVREAYEFYANMLETLGLKSKTYSGTIDIIDAPLKEDQLREHIFNTLEQKPTSEEQLRGLFPKADVIGILNREKKYGAVFKDSKNNWRLLK